jgi:Flp pilus assembly protein TadD
VSAQGAVGKLFPAAGRLDDAVTHPEMARQLDPRNKAVYSQLAQIFRRQGRMRQAQSVLAVLARLNGEEAAAIREAPPEHKGVYGAKATEQ